MIYKYNYRQPDGMASGYTTNSKWIGIQYWIGTRNQSIYYKDNCIYQKSLKIRIFL